MNDKKTSKSLVTQPKRDGAWVYMWIAHYDDGTSLPQYDPYTLKKNTFNKVKKDKIIKFGWYPFPSNLANRLNEKNKKTKIKSNIFLPKYEVDINENKRVIGALTTNFIKTSYFVKCNKCNNTFKEENLDKHGIGKGLMTYICPNCGNKKYWTCSSCGKKLDILKDNNITCECGGRLKSNTDKGKLFTITSTEERWRIYKLGWQETVNGINKKVIMHIHENGDVELKDN